MLLKSNDGSLLELELAGYQYPDLEGSGTAAIYDFNWLMVTVRVEMSRNIQSDY